MRTNTFELISKGPYQSSEKEKESRCHVIPSSTKREIRHFHIVVVQQRQRNVQKIVMHVTAAGLAQSVGRLTAEREVADSIPGAGPLLRVLKWLINEGTPFALQVAGPSRGLDDNVKWGSMVSSRRRKKIIVYLISTFVQNTLTLK